MAINDIDIRVHVFYCTIIFILVCCLTSSIWIFGRSYEGGRADTLAEFHDYGIGVRRMQKEGELEIKKYENKIKLQEAEFRKKIREKQ